jgi:C4-type Zn-finger protein
MEKLQIGCPVCGDSLFYTKYVAPLKILSERSWHYCRNCGYEMEFGKLKKSMTCA